MPVNILATLPQAAVLSQSSAAAVEQSFVSLQGNFAQQEWLPITNRYRDNCIDVLGSDHDAQQVNGQDLTDYISASALPHCLDGWSFFGRAINALLRGDVVACRHLVYYSELRASMALLATAGVGIFDGRHYVVNGLGSVLHIPKYEGTHVVAWKALLHWACSTGCADLLEEIITPGGIPIGAWQSGIFSKAGFQIIGKTWLQYWGLDVQLCANDQNLRNLSSYRPSRLKAMQCVNAGDRSAFVKEFWRLCEPSGSELFQRLDRQLLRSWLRNQYFAVKNLPANSTNQDYVNEITSLVEQVQPQGLNKEGWINFICDVVAHPESPLIVRAAGTPQPIECEQHLDMMARGLMLLRLATGACRHLINNSGLNKDGLQFWWHRIGRETCLWDPHSAPNDPQDLWLDIQQTIAEIEGLTNGVNPDFLRTHRDRLGSTVGVIDEAERVAFWGMGL